VGGRRGGSALAVLGGVVRGEGTSARGRAAGNSGATRGSHEEQEVARGRPSTAGGAALSVGGGETEKQAGGRRKRISLQFQKIQGPECKPMITFNIGLK